MVAAENKVTQVVTASVEVVGAGIVATALAWWALVYYQVFLNTGFPLARAVPCLLATSDTCSLAMSLCTGHHLFSLTRYSENLLWIGIVVSSSAFLLRAVIRRIAR